jgi:hypothetical protein
VQAHLDLEDTAIEISYWGEMLRRHKFISCHVVTSLNPGRQRHVFLQVTSGYPVLKDAKGVIGVPAFQPVHWSGRLFGPSENRYPYYARVMSNNMMQHFIHV